MVVVLAVAAIAHPMGESAAGQTSVLVVFPDHVDVDYLVDVPNAFVASARPGSTALYEAMTTELASGLLLTLDGQAVSMRLRSPSPPPRPSSEHTTSFAIHLVAPIGPETRTIALQTANLQEASNVFAGDVRVHPNLVVETSSLLGIRDGRIVRDDTLRWNRGDENRVLTVTLADRSPAWWRWVNPPGDEPIRVGRARVPTARESLRPPTLTPALWGAAVALAAGAGTAGGRDWRGWAVAALGLVLVVLPVADSGWVELAAAGVAIVLLAGSWSRPALVPFAAGAAVAGLAGTTWAFPAAIGVILAFGLGTRVRAPRIGAAFVVAGVAALLVRAISGFTE